MDKIECFLQRMLLLNHKVFFVGVVGADVTGNGLPCENQPITSRLVLVCGTSTCHMAVSTF